MATLKQLEAVAGDIIGIAGVNGDIHKATVLRVDDFQNRPGMIPGVIYFEPPRPGAPKTCVYYRNSKTFRADDGTAPDYPDRIMAEQVPITFDDFIIYPNVNA